MRDNRILRSLYAGILSLSIFLTIMYSNSTSFSWIWLFIVLTLVGIGDSLITIYKDYHSGHVGKKTRSEIWSLISCLILLIVVVVLHALKVHI